jgi:hypothetical protein
MFISIAYLLFSTKNEANFNYLAKNNIGFALPNTTNLNHTLVATTLGHLG